MKFLITFFTILIFNVIGLSQNDSLASLELEKQLQIYNRPYLDSLILEDAILLREINKLDEIKALDTISFLIRSRLVSNPMKKELSKKLIMNNNEKMIVTLFNILDEEHSHPSSLRPYELMNFPVMEALYEVKNLREIWKIYLNSPNFCNDCIQISKYNPIVFSYFKRSLNTHDLQNEFSCDTPCGKEIYRRLFLE